MDRTSVHCRMSTLLAELDALSEPTAAVMKKMKRKVSRRIWHLKDEGREDTDECTQLLAWQPKLDSMAVGVVDDAHDQIATALSSATQALQRARDGVAVVADRAVSHLFCPPGPSSPKNTNPNNISKLVR